MRRLWIVVLMTAMIAIIALCNRREPPGPGATTAGPIPESSAEDEAESAPAAYRGAQLNVSITVDGKIEDWKNIPPIIEDAVGDVDPPGDPDVKTVRIALGPEDLYIFVELAVGWPEIFQRTNGTDMVGYLFFDTDNNPSTGDGNDWLARGCETNAHIGTGFSATYNWKTGARRGKATPTVDISYEIWKGQQIWTTPYHEDGIGEALAFEGPYIEASMPRRLLGLEPGAEIAVLFREHNGKRNMEWTEVRSLILPRVMDDISQ